MQILEKLGLAVLISGLPMLAGADQTFLETTPQEVWATLTKVDAKDRTIAAKGLFSTKTFHAGDHCKIVAVDKKEASLDDLRPGEKVKIDYQNLEGVLVADRIVERALLCHGTLASVHPKVGTLTMERERRDSYGITPVPKIMRIASDSTVTLSGRRPGMIGDLKAGDRVAVIYELPDGDAVAYRVREMSNRLVGTVDTIDLPDRTLKVKSMLGEKDLDLALRCQIVLNGNTHASPKELAVGQKYRFTYETVNGVNVVNYIAPA